VAAEPATKSRLLRDEVWVMGESLSGN
jgi:hypothetical protein